MLQTVGLASGRSAGVQGHVRALRYRPEIDGLRAVAVIAVILFHARFQGFAGGFVGVDVFFVISGYLITSLILIEKQTGTFSLLRFYERRARRILPVLFVVIIACLPLAWLSLLPDDMREFSGSLLAVATFSSNIFFWNQSGYFDSAVHLKPLVHTWSLAIEEQFYLLFPFLLLAIWRLSARRVVPAVIVLALGSLALSQWGAFNEPTATFYLLPTRGWELLIGALVAFFLSAKPGFAVENAADHKLPSVLSLSGALLIASAIWFFDENTPFPSLYALLPTLGTALVILFATPRTPVGRVLRLPLLVRIGLISYGLYLWHQPFFALAWHLRGGDCPTTLLFVALSCIAAVLALLTWKYVETPCRDRTQVRRPAFAGLITIGCVAMVGFGWSGSRDGYAQRYAGDDYLAYPKEKRVAYVWDRMNQLGLHEYTGSVKPKVLVIGDSFAADLVNALFESGIAEKSEISTFEIPWYCGNLFLAWDFSSHISPRWKNICATNGGYHNQALQKLMKQADVLLLASAWIPWVAELLPESIANIERLTGKRVVVVGAKNFGADNILSEISRLPHSERRRAEARVLDATINVDAYMRGTVSDYIDSLELVCGGHSRCPRFTERGELISFDGQHLTQAGARYFGEKLKSHPDIIASFGLRPLTAQITGHD